MKLGSLRQLKPRYLSVQPPPVIWEMIDDALARPHDIHAADSQGRSALAHVLWSAPPPWRTSSLLPLVDLLLAAGAGKKELTKTLVDDCDCPQWHEGLVQRGADPTVCSKGRK